MRSIMSGSSSRRRARVLPSKDPADSRSVSRAAEHTARLQAEADARHATQRLAVAQQQIAEYAEGRAEEARALANDSGKLQELLSQVYPWWHLPMRSLSLSSFRVLCPEPCWP